MLGPSALFGAALAAGAFGIVREAAEQEADRRLEQQPELSLQHVRTGNALKAKFKSRVPHHTVASREPGISREERMRRRKMERDARKPGQRFA